MWLTAVTLGAAAVFYDRSQAVLCVTSLLSRAQFALLLLKAQSPPPVMGLVAPLHVLIKQISVRFCEGDVNFYSENSKDTSIEFQCDSYLPVIKLAVKTMC